MYLTQMLANGVDGTPCPVRFFGFAVGIPTVLVYMFLGAWSVLVNNVAMDYISYGSGAATLFGAIGLTIAGKAKAEQHK